MFMITPVIGGDSLPYLGSITLWAPDTLTRPTSVRLPDAMTISGIDTTDSSQGVSGSSHGRDAVIDDIDAELREMETSVMATGSQRIGYRRRILPSVMIEPGILVMPKTRVAPAAIPETRSRPARRPWRGLGRTDVMAIASFVMIAFFLTAPLWLNLDHELREDPQDQAFFEWMLAHGARVVTDGVYPFFSDRMNYPDGVNMMANTSVLAISLPMTPVTLLFGPHVAFNTFLTLALAATGISWYLVLSRCFVTSRAAAWVGALFSTFAPSMVSHAGGHPNIVSQFLVPLIILRTLRLREPGRAVRNGLLLALFIVWQAFINLEVLFMTAVGLGIFTVLMAAARRDLRRDAVPFLKALGVAALAALVALAYPLYLQFFGPQAYHGLPPFIRAFGADLGSFVAYSRRSVAGDEATAALLAQNAAEENAFFGWGLVILFFGIVLWMRRTVAVVALAFVALLFAVLSLGPEIVLNGQRTGVLSLWALLDHVPVLSAAVPTRWAMAIAPVVGILLALAYQRAHDAGPVAPWVRFGMTAAIVVALLPLAPTPLPIREMAPVPEFVTAGTWRQYVDDRHTVVTLPLPDGAYPDPLRWSAVTGHEMRIARGYFLGPGFNPMNPDDRTAIFSAPWRPTDGMFAAIRDDKATPRISDARRAMTLQDLRYWRAAVVVLAPQQRDFEMRDAMSDILGFQPTWKQGVWVWDVRKLVDDPTASLSDVS